MNDYDIENYARKLFCETPGDDINAYRSAWEDARTVAEAVADGILVYDPETNTVHKNRNREIQQ